MSIKHNPDTKSWDVESDVSQVTMLQKISEDFGESTLTDFNILKNFELFKEFVTHVNKGIYIEPINITSSSGSVLVLIYDNFVIKLFTNFETVDKVIQIIGSAEKSPFCIKLLSYIVNNDTNFYGIVTNKINPLISHSTGKALLKYDLITNESSLLKLLLEIGNALAHIHYIGFDHGDCTLDNIGIIDNKFTLFDFNAGSLKGNSKNDVHTLLKSIVFNINTLSTQTDIPINNDIERLILFLKSSTIRNGDALIDKVIQYYKEYYDEDKSEDEIIDFIENYIINTM